MKKLMIAAAIICAAALSQAATVTWGSDAIKTPDNLDNNITKARVNVYYYAMNSASADLLALCLTQVGTGDTATWTVNSGYTSSAINSTLDGVTMSMGALQAVDKTTYTVGDTAYGAILITRDINSNGTLDVGDWYMIAQGSQSIDADAPYSPKMSGLQTANWVQLTAPGPDPVPEPTSGLLLLMGIAGLALKRKRA